MADAKRLVDAMRKAGITPENERTDIVFGIVQSMSPLTVKTDRLTLTEEFLIRSPFTYDKIIKAVPVTGPFTAHAITHNVTDPYFTDKDGNTYPCIPCRIVVWKGIKAGDKVIMLKCGKGQKYYILHKVPWDASEII